jgi:hypothetical protein
MPNNIIVASVRFPQQISSDVDKLSERETCPSTINRQLITASAMPRASVNEFRPDCFASDAASPKPVR